MFHPLVLAGCTWWVWMSKMNSSPASAASAAAGSTVASLGRTYDPPVDAVAWLMAERHAAIPHVLRRNPRRLIPVLRTPFSTRDQAISCIAATRGVLRGGRYSPFETGSKWRGRLMEASFRSVLYFTRVAPAQEGQAFPN